MNVTKQIFTLLSMIVVLAIITTLVIHGEGTSKVVIAFGQAFSGSLKSAMNN